MPEGPRSELSQWIPRNASAHPAHRAIVNTAGAVSYAELDDQVRRVAAGLSSLGVQAGDSVVLILPNSREFIVSFFAVASLGAVAVPLNTQFKELEITQYLSDAQPVVLIAPDEILPLAQKTLSALPDVDCRIVGLPGERTSVTAFDSLWRDHAPGDPGTPVSADAPVLRQYSSGSTGQPKTVLRTHRQLEAEAEHFGEAVQVQRDDRILCVVPLFHAHGLGNCMLAAARACATIVVHKSFERRPVLNAIEEEKITIFPGVPFMFRMLAETRLEAAPDLSSLRLCFSAGAPLPAETFMAVREKYDIAVRQLYGSTETGSISLNLEPDGSQSETVGTPLGSTRVEIFGEQGEVLAVNQVGEIGIQSPAMTDGYSGRADLTAQSFRAGFFFPGDIGRKDAEGRLFVTGRTTFYVNVAGSKVDAIELERLLMEHPSVSEAVVVGVPGPRGDEMVKAVIVASAPCSEAEILDFCRERVADFKLPRVVEFREEIPKSPLGKVLRKYLV